MRSPLALRTLKIQKSLKLLSANGSGPHHPSKNKMASKKLATGAIDNVLQSDVQQSSVAEPHHFYAAPAPGENFDAAPAAPAPTLLYSKAKFLKRHMLKLFCSYYSVRFLLLKI
jgi:hypothetical protein